MFYHLYIMSFLQNLSVQEFGKLVLRVQRCDKKKWNGFFKTWCSV